MRDDARDHDFDFHFLNRKRALFYHLMFHHSTSLHINHMIFLHTFLFGALLCSSTNIISLVLITVIFAMYASVIIRPLLFTAIYILGILILSLTAFYLEAYLSSSSTYELKKWVIAVIGGGIVLTSFMFQLLGHALYEELVAPPNLIHGFLAAPILEFQCFLYRWDMGNTTTEYLSITDEVKQGREFLIMSKRKKNEELKPKRISSSASASASVQNAGIVTANEHAQPQKHTAMPLLDDGEPDSNSNSSKCHDHKQVTK